MNPRTANLELSENCAEDIKLIEEHKFLTEFFKAVQSTLEEAYQEEADQVQPNLILLEDIEKLCILRGFIDQIGRRTFQMRKELEMERNNIVDRFDQDADDVDALIFEDQAKKAKARLDQLRVIRKRKLFELNSWLNCPHCQQT